jgi:cholesterol oxidase
VSANEPDVLVIGSGFGGSVAALRLAEKGYRVTVLEAGRRFRPQDFARTSWDVRRFLYAPRLGLHGIQRLTLLEDVLVLSGAGVGGGSLVYANVLHEPLDAFYADPQWGAIADWRAELAPWFGVVRGVLGAAVTPFESEAERVVREVARRLGAEETLEPTTVAVDFARCTRCGGCLTGCRHGAKNTLDRTYLARAEALGAVVVPEREAMRLRRAGGGWEVEAVRPGAWVRPRGEAYRAGQVVLAAGVLGTLRLLLRSGLGGPNVGTLVRSNSEAIVGAGARDRSVDYSEGIAIGSAFSPGPDTRVEPVRYGRGSGLMGLFSTALVDGGGSLPRPVRWLGTAVRHPLDFARAHRPGGWAERTVVLLVMQSRDNSLRVRWTGRRLRSEHGRGEPAPSWLPVANEAAGLAADAMGGLPGSALNEVLLGRPFTAHILGGAPISATPADGVLDAWQRVWTEPGLHVVDGAAVTANLGANPSLTIAAQAERALSFWPRKGEPDPRPPLGSAYGSPVPAEAPPRRARVYGHVKTERGGAMAGARRQDLLGRLADLSEEAIQRLADAPGADRVLSTLNGLRDRVDELQKRVRGLEDLERRVAALEKKVDRLSKAGGASASSTRTRARSSAKSKSGSVEKS